MRILVIEDNRDAAFMLSMLLSSYGYDVQTAYCGESGLEAASEFLPDVILMDIGLPGLNGYEVAAKLRLDESFKNTKIIAMTGYCQWSDRQQAFDAGCDEFMAKPIDHPKLREMLTSSS